MAGQVASLAVKLPEVRPDRPKDDQDGRLSKSQEQVLCELKGADAEFSFLFLDILEKIRILFFFLKIFLPPLIQPNIWTGYVR